MRFRIVRTHERGIPLPRPEIVRATGTLGELVTAQTADNSYKGTVIVARLHDDAGGSPSAELIPSLYQVTLRVLAPQGMLLTGHERIRRDRVFIEYVQGWWARLP